MILLKKGSSGGGMNLTSYLSDSNVQGWWKCDELTDGAAIEDFSGNNYDLGNGAIQEKHSSCIFGYGIRFDGITDQCNIALTTATNLQITQNLTVEGLFTPENALKVGSQGYWATGGGTEGWRLYSTNDVMYWEVVTTAGTFSCNFTMSTAGWVNAKRYFVRCVYDYTNGNIEIWLQNLTDDGTITKVASQGSVTGTISYNTGAFNLFCIGNNGAGGNHYTGVMDQIVISDIVRTADFVVNQNVIPDEDGVTNLGHRLKRFDSIHTEKVFADLLVGTVDMGHDELNDMPSSSNSDHDGRYYTETELDAGQLDNRYYTETETDALLAAQDEFTELTDTPSSYTGEAGKYPKVNSGETALEFTANVLEIENADRNIYVDHDTGSDSNDGTSWGNAFQTMQTAVDDILPFVAAGVNIRIYCRGEFTEGDEEGACCSVSKICIGNGNVWILADAYLASKTATGGSNNTITFLGTYDNDYWNNCYVWIYENTGVGQAKKITDSSSAAGVTTLTVDTNWTVNPDATSKFHVAGRARFTQPGATPHWKAIEGYGVGLRLFVYGVAAFDYDSGETVGFYCHDYAYMATAYCIGYDNDSGDSSDWYSTNYSFINATRCCSYNSGNIGFQLFRFAKMNVNTCVAINPTNAGIGGYQMSFIYQYKTYFTGGVTSIEVKGSALQERDSLGSDGSSYGILITDFSEIRLTGSHALSIDYLNDFTDYTTLPKRTSASAEPTPETGELRVWRDPDDNKTYLIYNDTDEGVRKCEMV